MSKLHTNDLFDLIKSLSGSEKRHFKLYASKHIIGEENNYVKLFDAIDTRKEYDEKKILSKADYISQLPQLKSRLHEIILKSLDIFYSADSAETTLHNKIHHIKILLNKKLHSQAAKKIQAAKITAGKHELFLILAELADIETKLLGAKNYYGKTEKHLAALYREEKQALIKSDTVNRYKLLSELMFLNVQKEGLIRNDSSLKKYDRIMNNKLMSDIKYANSRGAKYYYYLILSTYYWSIKKYEKAYNLVTKQISLMESYPEMTGESLSRYMIILGNRLISELHLKKFNEFLLTLEKLRKVPLKAKSMEMPRLRLVFSMELLYYIETAEFEKALQAIKNTEKYVAERKVPFESFLRENPQLLYHIGYSFFGSGDLRNALKWFNKIVNDPGTIRNDLYSFAKIFSLVIHYDLGHSDFLQYAVKSTYNFLHKRGRLYKAETLFMDFIRKNYDTDTEDETTKDLTDLKKSLLELKKDEFEKEAFSYFDFISWIDSKLSGKLFSDLKKEAAKPFQ